MTDLLPPHIKKLTNIKPCTFNFQNERHFQYKKKTIIKTLISRDSDYPHELSSLTNL